MKKLAILGKILTWYTPKDKPAVIRGSCKVFTNHNFLRRKARLVKLVYSFRPKPKWFITLIIPPTCRLEKATLAKDLLDRLSKNIRAEFPYAVLGYKLEHKNKDSPGYDSRYDNVGVHIHMWGRMGTRIKKSEVKDWFYRKWSNKLETHHPNMVNVKSYRKNKHRGYLTKPRKNDDDKKVMEKLYPRYSFGTIGMRSNQVKEKEKVMLDCSDEQWAKIQEVLNNRLRKQAKKRNGINQRHYNLINHSPDGFSILTTKDLQKIEKILVMKLPT